MTRDCRSAHISLADVATSADQPSDSLVEALGKARIPLDNHAFIRRITTGLGIIEFQTVERADKPYVVAKRDDGRDLHIYYGYTVGFPSEDEIVSVLGSGSRTEAQQHAEEHLVGWSTRSTGCTTAASALVTGAARPASASAECNGHLRGSAATAARASARRAGSDEPA